MRSAPPDPLPAPPDGVRLERVESCPPAFYRFLYGEVGRAWQWVDRLGWPDERLAAHLADPRVRLYVATSGGAPAGWFELVAHDDGSTEIAYFGLFPHALGRGLGRWLLAAALAEAWGGGPRRVWLHTCTLDHPAALPNYLRRGFTVTRVERYQQPLP
jgi:GNAT superfamily N-acetyltransferase